MKQKLLKFRLIANGVFCTGIIVLFLPLFFSGLAMLIDPKPHPASWDADQIGAAQTVTMAYLSAGLFALAALVSLVRTVKKWRVLAKAEQDDGGKDHVA